MSVVSSATPIVRAPPRVPKHVPHSRAPAPRARPAVRQTFIEVLGEGSPRRADAFAPRAATGPPTPPATTPGRSPTTAAGSGGRSAITGNFRPSAGADALRRAIDRTFATEARLDAMIAAAARGKTFSAGELLALQATAFRYAQTVEILSHGTDRLVGALKQSLATSV